MITDYDGIIDLDEHIGYVPEFSKGDIVWDDLTHKESVVLEVLVRAYKLDSEHLNGYRFAWEVSKNKDNK
jgi:hypothetical protein